MTPGLTALTQQHRLGPVSQIPRGEGRAFVVAGEQIAIFRMRDDSLRGVSAVCPHRGGPIADGQIDANVVLCPLHLNAFDLRTGCSLTGADPLRSYDVTVEDGLIVVTLPPHHSLTQQGPT